MRTGTEFISEISAATIFTAFNFHIFRLSGKGEVDVYRMCIDVLYCLDLLTQYPIISPPGSFKWETSKVVKMKKLFQQSLFACLYANYMLLVK